MTPCRKNVTIAEMASHLGVSTATIAKALNGQGRISPAMVEKVRNLARELHYVPNSAARALRTNVKDAVGVLITSDIINPWYSQLVSLLEAELSKRKLTMLLALGKEDTEKIWHVQENFFGNRVAGIIAGPFSYANGLNHLQPAISRNIPLVVFNNLENQPLNFVAIDQEKGAELAIEHLLQLGHQKIVYLGCPHSDEPIIPATRYAGFCNVIRKHGLPVMVIKAQGVGRQEGFRLMHEILERYPAEKRPTAIFCHNDDIALGALMAIKDANLRVPEDIAVVGFDDIAEASYSLPALTTVGGVMESLATELVKALECVIAGKRVQKLIKPELIIRASTLR